MYIVDVFLALPCADAVCILSYFRGHENGITTEALDFLK